MTIIGVLGIQGDFAEHLTMLRQIGVEARDVRKPEHLADLNGLIIPGGESTTLNIVARATGMFEPLRAFAAHKPTWGTCAGAIMLATHIEGQDAHFKVMDITIARNAFGRQIDSFVAPLHIPALTEPDVPLRGVFIRAPIIRAVGPEVDILAQLDDQRIVAARQGHLLATSFHPELTPDIRMHEYFVGIANKVRLVA